MRPEHNALNFQIYMKSLSLVKESTLLEMMFLTSLSSSVIWDEKECFLYWGCKAHSGQGPGELGLGGGREKPLLLLPAILPRKTLFSAVAGGEDRVAANIKAWVCAFLHHQGKSKARLTSNGQHFKVCDKVNRAGWGCVPGQQRRHHTKLQKLGRVFLLFCMDGHQLVWKTVQ